MNRLTRFYKARLPGAMTLGLVWMQTSLFPARHYRRVAAVMRKLNRPKAVLGGPFAGMRYTQAPDKAFLARLFGTYELETYPAIERLITFDPDVVAVAGAGEGYFAVGMAPRLPRARVHAFEIWKWARYCSAERYARTGWATVWRCTGFARHRSFPGCWREPGGRRSYAT